MQDPLAPFPLKFTVGFLLMFTALNVWVIFDTTRFLRLLMSAVPSWWPVPKSLRVSPAKKGWVWFYRIDSGLILAGILYLLAAHWSSRPY